jgi:hypothetical protein
MCTFTRRHFKWNLWKIVLVVSWSNCIITIWFIDIFLASGNIYDLTTRNLILWMMFHHNFLHILFHVLLWIIMSFTTLHGYKLHTWIFIKLWLLNTLIIIFIDVSDQQKPFAK